MRKNRKQSNNLVLLLLALEKEGRITRKESNRVLRREWERLGKQRYNTKHERG